LVLACVPMAAGTGRADTVPADGARAVNVVPPGESGFISLTSFAENEAGLSTEWGPNFADQLPLYSGWSYKPMQFEKTGSGIHPGGDANVTVYRDDHGVPQVYASSEDEMFFGEGYAMAQDRLFQMEALRRVGHGTLAELTGASALPMDEAVRRVSEGPQARAAELAAQPPNVQSGLASFARGVNQYISEATTDPGKMPAEFVLLADLPIQPWTADDTLAFGEYAARFFGEFGHGELSAARTYLGLVAKYGQTQAELAFDDLFPLDDPRAPHSIPTADGIFPRHTGGDVPSSFTGSRYANHDPSLLPTLTTLAPLEAQVDSQAVLVSQLQRLLAIPRFGSNAIIESGSRSDDGNPRLYGGPQTGWAVPGFFWEVELHDPQRDERGVAVPAIPLLVIGRNRDSAWTVTSGLDANSDLFMEQLDPSDRTYVHDGQTLTVAQHQETINCHNPPTAALDAVAIVSSGGQGLCPLTPTTMTVYRTVHGPALADPDSSHRLYVRQSAVDNRLLPSFEAWDNAGLQHDAAHFGAALQDMALCFNFFYADAGGEIAYFHVGKLPIRPGNADPTLPMPGTGAYDWQGFEAFANMPHVVNPSTGYLVNWNNKPAKGWWSKQLDPTASSVWGDEHQVVPLSDDLAANAGQSFQRFGQFPRDVAYVDNRARALLPYLLPALATSSDSRVQAILPYLRAWNQQRNDVDASGSNYSTPAVVFFDRLVEHLIEVGLEPVIPNDALRISGMADCASPPCHLVSVDNLLAPTYKFEFATYELLLAQLRGETAFDWFAAQGGAGAVMRRAAADAAAEIAGAQGSDVSKWNEPVERGAFSAQGAGSVPDVVPLPNRGSYGQVVEPLATTGSAGPTAAAVQAASTGGPALTGLVNTAAGAASSAPGLLALLLVVAAPLARRTRRRSASP
jgi:penicillin G amidase